MKIPYFLVWNPVTGYTMYRHENYDAAITEAKRLAAHHSGQEFLVLGAMASAQKSDIVVKEYVQRNLDDQIPF